MRSSPRASIGLIMLPASIAPSAAPAPTMVWSSSTKVMTSPAASVISLRTAFSRSSNSPRYLAPASMLPMSSATRRLPFRPSGTSPAAIRPARPSTMAVLPTPGSPISTGLFLVRRDSTWMTRRISSSRPMTGSILPSRARWVRSCPYFSRAWNWSSGFWRGDAMAAPDVAQRLQQLLAADAQPVAHGQQQVLDGQVVVPQVLARRPRPRSNDVVGLAAEAGLGAAVGVRQLGHGLVGPVAQHQRRQAQLLHHGRHDGVVLAHQRAHQVVRRELGVAGRLGRLDGGRPPPAGSWSSTWRGRAPCSQATAPVSILLRVVSSFLREAISRAARRSGGAARPPATRRQPVRRPGGHDDQDGHQHERLELRPLPFEALREGGVGVGRARGRATAGRPRRSATTRWRAR